MLSSANYLHGVKESPDHLQLSSGQLDSIGHIRADLESLGALTSPPRRLLRSCAAMLPGIRLRR